MAKPRNLIVVPGDQLDFDALALDRVDARLDAVAALGPGRLA